MQNPTNTDANFSTMDKSTSVMPSQYHFNAPSFAGNTMKDPHIIVSLAVKQRYRLRNAKKPMHHFFLLLTRA
jgi:hypothetical protein